MLGELTKGGGILEQCNGKRLFRIGNLTEPIGSIVELYLTTCDSI